MQLLVQHQDSFSMVARQLLLKQQSKSVLVLSEREQAFVLCFICEGDKYDFTDVYTKYIVQPLSEGDKTFWYNKYFKGDIE